MDTRIGGGDFVLAANGLPQAIGGTDELMQRIYIHLCAKKGGFPLDPALGSELHRLRANTGDVAAQALAYARAALARFAMVTVRDVRVQQASDALRLRFAIEVDRQNYELEVHA